jgi:hypothetical protein
MDVIKHGVYYRYIKMFGHGFDMYFFCYEHVMIYISVHVYKIWLFCSEVISNNSNVNNWILALFMYLLPLARYMHIFWQ